MKERGFTLIEIIVVMAIVSILAAFAVPGYSQYIAKGKLRTVQGDLQTLALLFEQRYQRVLSFPAEALADTAALTAVFTTFAPASEATEITFSNSNPGLTEYTVVATGTSGHMKGCSISLTHNGVKAISGCTNDSYNGEWQ